MLIMNPRDHAISEQIFLDEVLYAMTQESNIVEHAKVSIIVFCIFFVILIFIGHVQLGSFWLAP